ncbi:MAG: molybdopterin-dependent oxidoreductase [Bermanella sp.]
MSEVKTHLRTCNICEAMCGLEIKYQDKQILSIKGDKLDPFSQGHICPKATAMEDFYKDEERLKTPIKRTKDGWEDISWEDAFAEITSKIQGIQAAHGKDALGLYMGNPNAHNLGNAMFLPAFIKALGTKNRYSSASTDQMPHHVASNYMLGAGILIPVPDIDRTDFMLVIGGNPVVSNGSMMTAPNVQGRLKAIQKRGGKVVVVDPRRTETAKMADQHLFIRPEKDALLLMSMIHTVFANKQVDLGHLQNYVEGLDKIEALVKNFDPEEMSAHIGIEAAEIKKLATDMSNAKSAVCYSRMGASTQTFGGLCQWLTNVFNIITGNFDNEGGAMFPQPAFDLLRRTERGQKTSYGRFKSRVRKLPYFNGEFPVATLMDEIVTEGEGQIKALITVAGNPVLSSPSGDKLGKAFEGLDFMVAVDIYLNETTKHADIILPATTGLENSHYDIFFNSFSVRNNAKYSEPLFAKEDNQRADWEILKGIASGLTGIPNDGFTPELVLDMELKTGPYGEQGLSLQKLKENPHGIDLGPLQSCLIERIKTADGKVNLAPQLYLDDIPRLKEMLSQPARDENYPFDLIGRRLARSHNTWTQNSRRLVKGKNPCTLQLSPKDAQNLGIENGQLLSVSSNVGEVKIEALINDDILQGVVSMPQGWGHNHKDTGMSIAATQPGVSINDLTDANRVDLLTGNAALNGTKVNIKVA